jgi:CheY-like chemotaxis protein
MKTILIVEDEEILRAAYVSILNHEGYNVLEAANGDAALKIVQKTKPDLILLDILMPVMDGYEFLQQSKLSEHPEVKVLAFSNLSDQEKLQKILGDGASRHVLKSSLSPKQLVKTIKDLLED